MKRRERETDIDWHMDKWRDRQAKNQKVRERQAEMERDGGKEKLRERQRNHKRVTIRSTEEV